MSLTTPNVIRYMTTATPESFSRKTLNLQFWKLAKLLCVQSVNACKRACKNNYLYIPASQLSVRQVTENLRKCKMHLGQNKCTFRTVPADWDRLNLARTRAAGPLVRVAIHTVNNDITKLSQSSPPHRRNFEACLDTTRVDCCHEFFLCFT